jgi:GTP-binding protein YchF
MPLSCGVVGMPNAGKSTLYNALTAAGAEVAGYPFCTVDRNIGTTLVPDERLQAVARYAASAKQTPASLQVVDIAGLVRGASRGEGLGNKFLGHIREVDCILHVVRCYDNPTAPHILGTIDPVRDAGVVSAELMLADLTAIERRREKIRTPAKVGEVAARAEMAAADELAAALDAGTEVRLARLTPPAMALAAELNLLTAKPVVYVANVPDPGEGSGGDAPGQGPSGWAGALRELAARERAQYVAAYARALMDLGAFEPAERAQVAADFGVSLEPLGALISAAYQALDLITFFTANRSEARAWPLRRGSDSVGAAGKVHTDFARGFIAVEVLAPDAYRLCANRAEAQRTGVLRLEGREYVVRDGDLCEFRFSV